MINCSKKRHFWQPKNNKGPKTHNLILGMLLRPYWQQKVPFNQSPRLSREVLHPGKLCNLPPCHLPMMGLWTTSLAACSRNLSCPVPPSNGMLWVNFRWHWSTGSTISILPFTPSTCQLTKRHKHHVWTACARRYVVSVDSVLLFPKIARHPTYPYNPHPPHSPPLSKKTTMFMMSDGWIGAQNTGSSQRVKCIVTVCIFCPTASCLTFAKVCLPKQTVSLQKISKSAFNTLRVPPQFCEQWCFAQPASLLFEIYWRIRCFQWQEGKGALHALAALSARTLRALWRHVLLWMQQRWQLKLIVFY